MERGGGGKYAVIIEGDREAGEDIGERSRCLV